MGNHPRRDEIDDLVLTWHERFQEGEDPSLATICGATPELLSEVTAEVNRIRIMEGAILKIRENDTSEFQPKGSAARNTEATETLQIFTRFLKKKGTGPELGWLAGMRVIRLLGLGGMGAVFLAEDDLARRQVALKVLRPDRDDSETAKKRFLREARLAAAIADDHVMPIFQVGEENGALFIVMPHFPGETLADRLEVSTLSPAEVVRLGRHIALGLEAAHKRGIIHRDVKPSNIWLEQLDTDDEIPWRGRVLDFGLARDMQDLARLTASGIRLGTPRYIAPEQAKDSRVDHLADLFSLGVVLYEATTGSVPFERRSIVDLLNAIISVPASPEPLRTAGLPEPMTALILRMLDKEPSRRPRSAAEVAVELRAISRSL